jgi:hypothetical protein
MEPKIAKSIRFSSYALYLFLSLLSAIPFSHFQSYLTIYCEEQRAFAKNVNSTMLHAIIKKIFFLMKKREEQEKGKEQLLISNPSDPSSSNRTLHSSLAVIATPDVLLTSSFLSFFATEIVAKRGPQYNGKLFNIT